MKRITISVLLVLAMAFGVFQTAPHAYAQATNAAPGSSSPPPGVVIEPGYSTRAVITGLDFPTAFTLSRDHAWVSEAGVVPGIPPKIKEIDIHGNIKTILSPADLPEGMLLPPITDVKYHNGWLWITHRQIGANGWMVGAISKFDPKDPAGTFTTVLTNLPSSGDHFTEQVVFDQSGRAYFSQGTATNSGVVGADNWYVTGWLQQNPNFHDFAPKDILLNGSGYQTAFPFPLDPDASKTTAPYMPFGSGPVPDGTPVQGATPATPQEGIIAGNGTVYSFDPTAADPASTLRLEGWGFRNPYGIGFDPFNPDLLFVSNNGSDYRAMQVDDEATIVGSRPIGAEADDMFIVHPSGNEEFFGWPDYFHDEDTGQVKPVTDPAFCSEEEFSFPCPPFVFAKSFRESLTVQPTFSELEEHSSANKFDFSRNGQFGFPGDIFIAETGSLPPGTGADELVGFKVVRIDRKSGETSDFIAHTEDSADVIFNPKSINKPIDVDFHGRFMFITDFGVFEPFLGLTQPGTGKIWLVINGEFPVKTRQTVTSASLWEQVFDLRADSFLPIVH